MKERGLSISQYALCSSVCPCIGQTNDSSKVDETYTETKGQWMHLYRAVDPKGNTIDFRLSKTRNQKAAMRFFKKVLP